MRASIRIPAPHRAPSGARASSTNSSVLGRVARAAGLLALLAGGAGAQVVFEPPVAAASGGWARRVHLGDVNGDGVVDAVTSESLLFPISGGVSWLNLGQGDGTFGPPTMLPTSLAFGLGDFDGDDDLDLVGVYFLGTNSQSVSVFFNDGTGAFGPALGISTPDSAQDADDGAIADFDGDGALDVAVHRGVEPFLFGRIMVIFGDGRGGFGTPVIVVPFVGQLSNHEGKIRAGDVNGDGLTDLVYTRGTNSPTLLSNGDKTFQAVACPAGCGVVAEHDFVLADLDGDGRSDAVTTHRVLLGQADGSLMAVQALPSDGNPVTVALGDLDGDGALDVVQGRNISASLADTSATAGDVRVLRGLGDGTFDATALIVSHVPQPRDLAVADLDGDARPDVCAAVFQDPLSTRVLLNHTYGAGSPWLDVGHALPGSAGWPILLAEGSLVAGTPYAIRLENGLPNGQAKLFVGLSSLFAPFKQGVMVPTPLLFFGPVPLDGTGAVGFAGLFPPGASGAEIWMQWWLPLAGGPAQWAASSGVRAQVP